jgi:predicted DNA-binding helix-hairpin-helix protein
MNTKKTFLTKAQETYIDLNWELYTHEAIAVEIGVSATKVSNYCAEKGYKKIKKLMVRIEKKIVNPGPEKKHIKRPPAIYSNRSHEEVLNYYENLEV